MSPKQWYHKWRARQRLDAAARSVAAGDDEGALRACRKAAGLGRTPKRLKWEAHRGAADALSRLARLGDALPHLRMMVALGGGVSAWRRAAKALHARGETEEELKVWLHVLKDEPGDLTAHDRLADLYDRLGQSAQAIEHARLVARASPLDPAAWRRFAGLLSKAGDWPSALSAGRRAAALADHPSAVRQLNRGQRDLASTYRAKVEPAAARPRVVNAAIGAEGLQLFQVADLPGVRVFPLNAPDTPDPDIIVFPSGTTKAFEKSWAATENALESMRAQAAKRGAMIVLDASTEGAPHQRKNTGVLHEFLARLGAAPERGVYLTQDRNYRGDYLEHCAELKIARPMTVLNFDSWIWRFVGQFEEDGEAVFRERLEAFNGRLDRRERRFVSLNFTPRQHKVLFLLSLLRDDLWARGHISFGGVARYSDIFSVPQEGVARHLATLKGFDQLALDLAPFVGPLSARGQRLFGAPEQGKLDTARDLTLPEYGRSWFSVVTETEMGDRPTRITEKPLKPLVNFHPFLVLGNPGALAMIRDLGFATFDEIFDESYDEELNPRRRFDLVYRQVERLCRMDEGELAKLETAVADKLIFNAHWGLTKLSGVWRRRALSALVEDILAAMRPGQA